MGLYEVVVVGGGTSGWMTAAALAKFLPRDSHRITLIESEQIGTVGVGEATIPHIRHFNAMLEIDEKDFIRATGATYKLGIQFENWGQEGDSYIHPFGHHGRDLGWIGFQHCWLKLYAEKKALSFDSYSLASMAAKQNKFQHPSTDPQSLSSSYTYAFHLDASLYARYLRSYAECLGVNRKEGKINGVSQDADSGIIESVVLEDGLVVRGDFFVDCSGFSGLLIEKALNAGYEDWSHWLLCDSAVAVATEKVTPLRPYTRAIAREFGWQWQIPLQHRTGNGYVYSSHYISDDGAEESLKSNLQAAVLGDVRLLKFNPGQRKESWKKNCVAIGLSSGFLEPLESTSIYLVQMAILKLLEFFPCSGNNDIRSASFNRFMKNEYELVRDFLILHYNLNFKKNSPFWNYCAAMEVPDSLKRKMELFKRSAQVEHYDLGLFMPPSWLAVYLGQGFIPKKYDIRANFYPGLEQTLEGFDKKIKSCVNEMPCVQNFMDRLGTADLTRYPAVGLSLYGGS